MKTAALESFDSESHRTSSPALVMSDSSKASAEEMSEQTSGPTNQSECSQSAPFSPANQEPVAIEESTRTENIPADPSGKVTDCAGINYIYLRYICIY
jgi:hypothetical protein